MKLLIPAALLLLASCAALPTISPGARNELAPSGKIRAAINYGNPVLARRDGAGGELRGVAVDLARELGRELGLAVELVGYESAAKVLAGMQSRECDVAFAAIDPARHELAFSPAYMEVEVTYLVAEPAAVRRASEVDRSGMRVVVQARNAADLFLTRELRNASLERTANVAAAFEALRAGSADAYADNRQHLQAVIDSNPGYRIVEGRFSTIRHALAVPAAHHEAARYLEAFVARAKARGAVDAAIGRAQLRGVAVAP
jgi:polar amino acid transport system substrate-binding protein